MRMMDGTASWLFQLAMSVLLCVPLVVVLVLLAPNLIDSGLNGWITLVVIVLVVLGLTIKSLQWLYSKPEKKIEGEEDV